MVQKVEPIRLKLDLPGTNRHGKLASTRLNFTTTKDYSWHVR